MTGLLAVMSAGVAGAQAYPAKTVRVICPNGVGGTADILARQIGAKVGERLGRQFIVNNRPGAAGQLGLELAARAAPDGYTISMGQGTNLAITPHTYKNPRYDPLKDFAPVAVVATSYSALVVHPGTPFKTAKELIAYGRAHPNKLTATSGSELGFQHLSFELLRLQSGARFVHVAYKGSAAIVSDLISGQVELSMSSYTAFAPHIRSGRMRLAITNPTRVPLLPQVPTLAETVPGYDMRGWYGFVAPPPCSVRSSRCSMPRLTAPRHCPMCVKSCYWPGWIFRPSCLNISPSLSSASPPSSASWCAMRV